MIYHITGDPNETTNFIVAGIIVANEHIGDLYPNMLFMRESNGKLRVDLIDYENLRSYDKFADERSLDNMFSELHSAGLAE